VSVNTEPQWWLDLISRRRMSYESDRTFFVGDFPPQPAGTFLPFVDPPVPPLEHKVHFPLTVDSYQHQVRTTAVYPGLAVVVYPTLGLAGESGETAQKVRDAVFPEGCPVGWDPVTSFLKTVWHTLDSAAAAGAECERLKKRIRDKRDSVPEGAMEELRRRVEAVDPEQRLGLLKEIGDVLWYVSSLTFDMNAKLSEVCQGNLDKLAARKAKGTLHGSGDDR
jgi:NTP pyrophosphatase (non-canonical NTP hydrolase)